MSHKQKTTTIASLKPMFDQVCSGLDLLDRVGKGESIDDDVYNEALDTVETFCRIAMKVLPHAKPSVIQEAATLCVLEALPGKPLPPTPPTA